MAGWNDHRPAAAGRRHAARKSFLFFDRFLGFEP
jgi:hypothetical protein